MQLFIHFSIRYPWVQSSALNLPVALDQFNFSEPACFCEAWMNTYDKLLCVMLDTS